MLDKPQIVQVDAQLTAVIRFTIPREEIQKVMGPGIGELLAAVAAQGMTPAAGLRYRSCEGGPVARREGGADRLSRALRGAGPCLGRV